MVRALRAFVASSAVVLSSSVSFAQGSSSAEAPVAAPETRQETSPATDPRKASEARVAFEEGLRLLRAERWIDAEAQFRRSLDREPRPSASYDLAFVLYKQGRGRESRLILEDMLEERDSALSSQYREYARALLERVVADRSMPGVAADPGAVDPRIEGEVPTPASSEPPAAGAETRGPEASAPAFAGQPTPLPSIASVARADRRRPSAVTPRASEVWLVWGATALLATGAVTSGILALGARSDLVESTRYVPRERRPDRASAGPREDAGHCLRCVRGRDAGRGRSRTLRIAVEPSRASGPAERRRELCTVRLGAARVVLR